MIKSQILRNILKRSQFRSHSYVNIKNTLTNGATTIPLPLPISNNNNPNEALSTLPTSSCTISSQQQRWNWYSCGPTVYDSSHLGHARTYLSTDIIYRILNNYFCLPINFAMGMTDIDDKIIKRSLELNKPWLDLAREYEQSFLHDINELNISRPQTILRVSEHVPDIISYIENILKQNKAYITDTGVYFDVKSNLSTYGKLGKIPTSNEEEESNESDDQEKKGKRDSRDFALWKLVDIKTPHWDSPWGPGRPGWHIECSAMSHAYFGSQVDIHSGGIDLRFPHHTNEIAQSEAHNCSCHWVSYWIHTGHLFIDGYKMSKSLKNFITIENYLQGKWSLSSNSLTSEGVHPFYKDRWTAAADLRIFFLQHKYHSSLYLTEATLKEAINWRVKIENMLQLTHPHNMATQLHSDEPSTPSSGPQATDRTQRTQRMTSESLELLEHFMKTKSEIHAALADDFNTPAVLLHLSKLSSHIESYYMNYPLQKQNYSIDPIPSAREYVVQMVTLFGLIVHENRSSQSSLVRVAIHGSKSSQHLSSSEESLPSQQSFVPSPAVIDSLVSFRRNIRKQALQASKEIKVLKKKNFNSTSNSAAATTPNPNPSPGPSPSAADYQDLLSKYEQTLTTILSSCDETRTQLSSDLGIEIHDLNEKTVWKINPKIE